MTSEKEKERPQALGPKLRAAWAQMRFLPRVGRLLWRASKGWTLLWILLLCARGILPVGLVLLTKTIVDHLVKAVGSVDPWAAAPELLFPAVVMAGLLLLNEVINGVVSLVREHQAELLQDHMAELIHETSTRVDLSFYDAPDYYDHLHRARDEARYRPVKLMDTIGGLFTSGVTLIAMGVVLIRFSALLPLVLLLTTLPALHVVLKHAVKRHRWRIKNTSKERESWYCDWEMTNPKSAAELRAFNLAGHFSSLYKGVRAKLRKERRALHAQQSIAEILAALAALLATGGCLAWMGWRTLEGDYSLGELALFFAAFRQGQQMMRGLLGNVGDVYRNILFLGDLFEFLDLEPFIKAPAKPVPLPQKLANGLAFEQVTFSYPGSSVPALKDLSMEIPAGKTTAVVGPNGSGKSTVIKLICRLYDPEKGRLRYDGTDLTRFDPAKVRDAVSILFQEPVHFNRTAQMNISFGKQEAGRQEVDEAAKAAAAEEMIAGLPNGYETLLGKWFEGGKELSVGQWQRIALARAFLKDAPLILLDEPTSAMDSWAETDWMLRLRKLSHGRTTVVVTHRFTTAMKADLIHVLDGGVLVESGSHEELVAGKGMYSKSWKAQMERNETSTTNEQ